MTRLDKFRLFSGIFLLLAALANTYIITKSAHRLHEAGHVLNQVQEAKKNYDELLKNLGPLECAKATADVIRKADAPEAHGMFIIHKATLPAPCPPGWKDDPSAFKLRDQNVAGCTRQRGAPVPGTMEFSADYLLPQETAHSDIILPIPVPRSSPRKTIQWKEPYTASRGF